MSTVFISYRRQTDAGEARALFNDLVVRLGKGAVFIDIDSISLGRDFRIVLQKTLATCGTMLVMIDKDWAAAKDEKGRIRLENAGDYVRIEIETALKRDIAVTPILIRGAHMPAADELPAEISDLAYRNYFELSHNRWKSDVRKLILRLGLDVPDPQGDATAQYNLGINYMDGLGGVSKDDREAARLFKLAADKGNASAQGNLGLFYESGRGGLPKDDREAARLYKLASDQGNAAAQRNLGFFYEKGRGGLPKDDRKAERLYKLAADQGNEYAQLALKRLQDDNDGDIGF